MKAQSSLFSLKRSQHRWEETSHVHFARMTSQVRIFSLRPMWSGADTPLPLPCSPYRSATVNVWRHPASLWGHVSLSSNMSQEIKPWSKPGLTVEEQQGNIKALTVEKHGRLKVGLCGYCVCVCVSFLLIYFIRVVKLIQQSSRIVSTPGPPVGLRVLRFTVASLSCPTSTALIAFCLSAETFPRHLAACLSSLDSPSKSVTYSLHLTPHRAFLSQTLSK